MIQFNVSVCHTLGNTRHLHSVERGKSDKPKEDANWALAQQVASEMLTNPPRDPTGGAMFFHAVDTRAPWDADHERTVQIGRHIYYR